MHLISLCLTPVPLIKDFRLHLDFHFREKLTSIKLTIERLLIRTNCFPFFTLHFFRSVMQFCPDWTIECDLKRVVRNHRHTISEAVVIWSPSFSKHEKGDKKCLIMSPSGVRCNQWGSAKGEQTLKNQVRFDLPAHNRLKESIIVLILDVYAAREKRASQKNHYLSERVHTSKNYFMSNFAHRYGLNLI